MLTLFVTSAVFGFSKLEVMMKPGQDNLKSVQKVIRGLGKVSARNAEYQTFTIELNSGVSADKAIKKLTPKVARVRFDDFRHGEREFDRRSRRDVDRRLADVYRETKDEGESEESEEELEALGMMQYRLQRRAFPKDTYDPLAYRKAAAARKAMPSRIGNDSPGSSWSYQGPRNLSNIGGSATTFKVSGRATAAAFSPTDPDHTYYAGTANGGVWKTTNGGTTWVALTDDWPFLQVSDIKIDPSNANRIYVATGDAHAEESYGLGLMRSSDAGATWEEVGASTFNGAFQENILVDPDNTSFVTVAAEDGLYRSTNGGTSWAKVSSIPVRIFDVECGAHTSTNNRYYYASGMDGQIWRSTSRGSSWTRVLNNSGYGHIRAIACSPFADDTVYALCDSKQILKSTDYGATWSSSITAGFPHHRDSAAQDYKQWYQVSYDYQMVCSKRNALGIDFDVLYVGLFDLSMYSGSNWYEIGGTLTLTQPNPPIHCDHHDQEIHPTDPNKSLVASDGGIYLVTKNSDNSVTVANLNTGIHNYELWHMNAHPTNNQAMIGGIQHQGTAWSDGPSSVWDMANRGDGAYAVISPTNPARQFTSIQSYSFEAPFAYITRTHDNWATSDWFSIEIGSYSPAFIPPLAADPNNGNRIYLGGQYLSRWTDNGSAGGTPEARLGNKLFADKIVAISVAKTDSNRIYVGLANGQVWRSSDYGNTWTQISNSQLPTAKIESISVSLTNESNIAVTLGGVGLGSGHLFRCSNTLAATPTWEDRSGTGSHRLPDLPVQTLCRDPQTDDWYAGGESGCFWSNDFGGTWYNMTEAWGLPNVEVSMLHAPGNGYLYASTFGRGIWRMALGATDASLASVTINSASTVGGSTITGTVTLDEVAPPTGIIVLLSSSDSAATVPALIAIPQAQDSTTFDIDTSPVPADRTVTITASRSGVVKTDTFVLKSPGVIGLSGPTGIPNGLTGVFTVTLNGPAPAGGATVNLSSATVAVVVPSTMVIPAGQTSGTFVANTILVNSDATVAVTASRNTLFRTVGVTVMRYRLTSITTNPSAFYSGDSFTGTVTMDRTAPTGGADVPLFAPDGGSIPGFVNVPSGQVSGTFNGSAPLVDITQNATFQAKMDTNVVSVTRVVKPAELSSLTFIPSLVSQGNSTVCRLRLRGKAAHAMDVHIRILRQNGFSLTNAGTVTVPAGGDFVDFPITVVTAPRTGNAIVYASAGGKTISGKFAMQP